MGEIAYQITSLTIVYSTVYLDGDQRKHQSSAPTALVCWEFTGQKWIPITKASDTELWCFFISAPEQTDGETIEMLVIWDGIGLFMTPL